MKDKTGPVSFVTGLLCGVGVIAFFALLGMILGGVRVGFYGFVSNGIP